MSQDSTENGKIMHRANGNGSVSVSVSLPALLWEQADAQAARRGQGRSAYIRSLIEADLRSSGVAA